MIRMFVYYKFVILVRKMFGILNKIPNIFLTNIANFSRQIIRSNVDNTHLVKWFSILSFMAFHNLFGGHELLSDKAAFFSEVVKLADPQENPSSLLGKIEKMGYGQLLEKEKYALRIFLQSLMEDSEGGYVFFNRKPVCITGYEAKDSFYVNTERHKEAVALKEGAAIWQKVKKQSSDIIIHISQSRDPQIPQFTHVLIINKPLFYKVVQENLALFQYILGPSITPQKLFEKLVDADQPFHALLRYDKTLIGIILGFGVENSLYASRVEDIHEDFSNENIPFLANNLILREFDHEYLPCSPTFGFKTTNEETETLLKKMSVSSPKLNKQKPRFVFGLIKDNVENKKLISDLEDIQTRVQKLIKLENFEEIVLTKILGEGYSLNSTGQKEFRVHSKVNTGDIEETVAKGILESLRDYDSKYFHCFLEGIQNPDFQNIEVERRAYFPHYIKDFIEAKENLQAANEHFQSLDSSKEFVCLKPLKLYYKTLKTNESMKKLNGSLVTLTYSVYSPLGHCLSQCSEETINLKNTIPGFAYGVQKMAIGETRELYIHPTLIYNCSQDPSSINECHYLKAIVTLHEIHNELPFSEPKAVDLDFLFDQEVMKIIQENYANALREKGALIASHLRKSKEINLIKVTDYLTRLSSNRITTTPEEQDLINHVHWDIYFR